MVNTPNNYCSDGGIAPSLVISIVQTMDSEETRLFPFLPYIMQDLWELGSDPATITDLIKKHCEEPTRLRLLDLGCGKGAVAIRAAKMLNATCHGVDGVPDFVRFANEKAEELGVAHLCKFEVGDIRCLSLPKSHYGAVILGSIGQVFGNYQQTLQSINPLLQPNGIVIIDDGYSNENDQHAGFNVLTRRAIVEQIQHAGFSIVDEAITNKEEEIIQNTAMFESITKRCNELASLHPDIAFLFDDYIAIQEEAFRMLNNHITCVTFVLRKTKA